MQWALPYCARHWTAQPSLPPCPFLLLPRQGRGQQIEAKEDALYLYETTLGQGLPHCLVWRLGQCL